MRTDFRPWVHLAAAVSLTASGLAQSPRQAPVPGPQYSPKTVHISNAVQIKGAAGTGETVQSAAFTATLGPGRAAQFSGGQVLVTEQQADEVFATILDPQGQVLRQATVPGGGTLRAVGSSLMLGTLCLHQPGIPYSFEFISPGSSAVVDIEGRTVIDIYPLPAHVAISSFDEARLTRTDVLDGNGNLVVSFQGSDLPPARVTPHGVGFVAVFPYGDRSLVQWAKPGAGVQSLEISGQSFGNVASLSDGQQVIAWSADEAALLRVTDKLELVWERDLPAAWQLLNHEHGFVPVVGGSIALLARREVGANQYAVAPIWLKLAGGAPTVGQVAASFDELPASVRRFGAAAPQQFVVNGALLTPVQEEGK